MPDRDRPEARRHARRRCVVGAFEHRCVLFARDHPQERSENAVTLLPTFTRREAIRLCGAAPMAAWTATRTDSPPPLAAGTPTSAERVALIEAFRRGANGLDRRFEKRAHHGSWPMPYRLFRPAAIGKVPLVLYLHGSGGLGDDNEKQLALGRVFGTMVWPLPESERRFRCCVVAQQTGRGWARYKESPDGPARLVAGFGDGARLALDIVRPPGRAGPAADRPPDH